MSVEMARQWIEGKIRDGLVYKVSNYLFKRYLGRFVEDGVSIKLDEFDLIHFGCTFSNIRLNVQALNEMADKQNWPVIFIHGSIEKVQLMIPYRSITSSPSTIRIHDLRVTMQPKPRSESATSMFESMWSSMSSSKYMAEEVFDEEKDDLEETGYKGLDTFATLIEQILSMVKVEFKNTIFQIEYVPRDSSMGVGVIVNVADIAYKDDSNDISKQTEEENAPQDDSKKRFSEKSYTTRSVCFTGITVSTVEFNSKASTSSMINSMSEDSDLAAGKEQADPILEYDYYSSNENRHVIPFGKFRNKWEIVLKIKIGCENDGPKVLIAMDLSHLLLFLTSRQVQLLLQLSNGLICPEEDHTKTTRAKRMSEHDYETIKKMMQTPSPNSYPANIGGGHGWATGGPEEDLSENFQSFTTHRHASNMSTSGLSLESDFNFSSASSVTSYTTDATSRTNYKRCSKQYDPTAEISHFEIHMGALSVVLLHEDDLTQSADERGKLSVAAVTQARNTVEKFFEKAIPIFDAPDFAESNLILDLATSWSHLRLLAGTIHGEGDEKTTSSIFSISGYAESETLQLKECLWEENRMNHVDLIAFNLPIVPKENPYTAQTSLKVSFKHVQKTNKESRFGPKTDLSISLHSCSIEFDITILDRITALLNLPKIGVPTADSKSHWITVSAEKSSESESKLDFKICSPLAALKLRFPKPDFRPPHDMSRVPWWKRNVQNDYLTLEFTNFVFASNFENHQKGQRFGINSTGVKVFYHENSNSAPIPVAKGGVDEKILATGKFLPVNECECRISISINPPKKAEDEVLSSPGVQDPMVMSIAGCLEKETNIDRGPLCVRKIIYESEVPHSEAQKHGDVKDLKIPGDHRDIMDFMDKTIKSARILLEISLPSASVQLISKHLYEVIYNRINNDLLLWEPSAPKPKTSSASVYENYKRFPLDIDTAEEVFSLCTDGIHGGSDDDETEDDNIFYSTYDAKMRFNSKKLDNKKESYFVANLKIAKGLLSLYPPVRESATNNVIPGQQGEFFINLKEANVLLVNGYMGDQNSGYVCVEVADAELNHCDMNSTPSQSPPLKDIGAIPGRHLYRTLYKSEPGVLLDLKGASSQGANRQLITVCVNIQASHETHHVKNVTVSAGFHKATLRHRMCNDPNSWLTQIMDFFNVKDYPIPGYQAKEILTELFVHFWDSSIDYRPLYLPIRSVVTLGSFSISSHLSAETNTSTLRFIAEECGLFISRKGMNKKRLPYMGCVDLRRDYVNVIFVSLFDISLKTTDKLNKGAPHIDLRMSNNQIRIRTCADSARALTQLIKYVANDGDLLPPEDVQQTNVPSAFSSPRHQPEQKLVVVEPQEVASSVTASQHEQINQLIEDALVEDKPKKSPTSEHPMQGEVVFGDSGTNVFYFPGEVKVLPSCDEYATCSLPQVTSELGRVPQLPGLPNFGDDFCFIDQEAGYDIFPKNGVPEVKWLTDEPIRICDDHFNVPDARIDPLKASKDFPVPSLRYTLTKMSIVWNLYGGCDFDEEDTSKTKKNVNFEGDQAGAKHRERDGGKRKVDDRWIERGGPNRDHNVLMQVFLNKIRFQYELYAEPSDKASRLVVIVRNFEIKDRLKCSEINKFLYLYTSQIRPQRKNCNMLTIKSIFVKPDPQLNRQECCLKISLQPLRFYIDQDALVFLVQFFKALSSDDVEEGTAAAGGSKQNTPVHKPPILTVGQGLQKKEESDSKEIDSLEKSLIDLDENKSCPKEIDEKDPSDTSSQTETADDSPIYFRKLIFTPDVPIRLDYVGKVIDMSQGPISGVLMGLTHLNNSEIKLKRIMHCQGILGFDKLVDFIFKEWWSDLKNKQISGILVGLGPANSILALFKGIRDLFFMPFEQYMKDGKFFWGLQKGAKSFTTSTIMATIELASRLIYTIQLTAETAFDMLTPGPSVRVHPKTKKARRRYRQPIDLREAVTNAYILFREGLEETVENMVQVATYEHEHKGYSGAVGGIMRNLAPTVIKPVIVGAEATNNLLSGVRCQLIPDARKEVTEQWRSDDAYDSNL